MYERIIHVYTSKIKGLSSKFMYISSSPVSITIFTDVCGYYHI